MIADGRESDDEDDYFKPVTSSSGKSTLAKIFGIAPKGTANVTSKERAGAASGAPKPIKISERYGPSNFRYIPSAEADDTAEDASKPVDWSIVCATVVTAYKLVDTDNVFLGKVGLALLRSIRGLRLLLYRTKTDVLGTATLSRETKFFLKQDYVQFRADDSSDFWSVLFENETDRQTMLEVVESSCQVEREPVVEEPMSEVEKDTVEPSKNTRSELVARMARMGGQAMPLPERAKAPPIPATAPGSDSSDTSDSKIETISTRPVRRANVLSASGLQMVPLTGMVPSNSHTGPSLGPATGASAMADVNFNLVMSENRMQNTEMRMNLTKLESKLDRVLDRIDLLSLHGTGERSATATDKEAEILELEEKLLELKRANHSLKTKVRDLETIERDTKRDADAKLKEKLHTTEESQRRLQAEVERLHLKLETNFEEAEEHKKKCELVEKQRAEAQQDKESITKELETMGKQLEDVRQERDQLKEQLAQETVRSTEIRSQLEQLQKESDDALKREPNRPAAPNPASMVKEIMNGCYQQLCEQITDPHVLRIIAQTIKRETKAALEREKIQ